MIPQTFDLIAERKPVFGQPHLLKFGLAITVIHAIFLLLLLGKGL